MKNTQQITRAMKFVAAARLRRAQDAALEARPYALELARMLRSVISRISDPEHPLLAKREEKNVLAIVLSGERGLAGAFNSNILRKASDFLRNNRNKKIVVVPVGKKGRDALRKARFEFAAEYVNVLAKVDFGVAREISALVTQLYAEEKVDAVYIIFSEFKSVMSANLAIEKLLPIEKIQEDGAEKNDNTADYIYEQPEEQILGKLLPRYIETQVLRAMLESSAAEHAARMTAMESATKNAGEVIEGLTLTMNKVRQAAITKEIIEIVSGANYGT